MKQIKRSLVERFRFFGVLVLAGTILLVGCGGGGGGGGGGSSESDDDGVTGEDVDSIDPDMPVKHLELISDSTSPLLLTFIDDNDISFWFYAQRRADGLPEYINELIITEKVSGKDQGIITLYFDDRQRVYKAVLPNQEGEINLDYSALSEVAVTVITKDGISETQMVQNPFEDNEQSVYRGMLQDSFCRDWADIPWAIFDTWTGVVKTCEGFPQPTVRINKLNPDDNYQVDKTYLANVRPEDQTVLPGFYQYSYQVSWVDDYDKWQTHCHCMKNVSSGLLAADTIFPLFKVARSAGELAGSIVEDYYAESTDETAKWTLEQVAGDLTDSGLVGVAKQVGDFLASSGDPCSRDVYRNLERKILQPLEIEVEFMTEEKKIEFDPEIDGSLEQVNFDDICRCLVADKDNDGFYAVSDCGTEIDCDDNNPDVYPGTTEIPGDGIDQNCDGDLDVHYRLTSGGTLTGQKNGISLGSDVSESVTIDETAQDAHFTWAVLRDDGSFTVSASQVVYHYSGSVSCAGKTWWHGTYPTGGTSGSLNIERGECVVGPGADSDQFKWHGGSGVFTEDELTFNASFEIDAYGLCQFQYDIRIDRSE